MVPISHEKSPVPTKAIPSEKIQCTSSDGKWTVKTTGGSLSITDKYTHKTDYKVILSSPVNRAFFTPSEEYLFVIIRGIDAGILLFRFTGSHWKFVDELESIPNQNLLNQQLNYVYLTDCEIIFVYNSRVRKYSLANGALISNQARRNAGNFSYEGEDISYLFLKSTRQ